MITTNGIFIETKLYLVNIKKIIVVNRPLKDQGCKELADK